MTKKALIIYRIDRSDPSNLGVIRKLIGQIDGLEYNGFEVDFIIHDDQSIFLNDKAIHSRRGKILTPFFKMNFFRSLGRTTLYSYDLYLIRYGLSTPSFLGWLKQVKLHHPSSKILIDMPTFPYQAEWTGFYGKIAVLIDKTFRTRLFKYVDYMLHSGEEKQIFEIPVIPFSNGVQISTLRTRNLVFHQGYNFLAVGKWRNWHGLDRLINGLSTYVNLGNSDVTVYIVGSGPGVGELVKLTQKVGLNDFVKFKGTCAGQDLDELFDKADLGIGTLGLHRKNVKIDSSLKHREYTLRGLPFVLSSPDSDQLESQDFTIQVSADEREINIHELIDFINRLNKTMVIKKMRTFAEEHLSWRSKMSKLLTQMEYS